MEKSSPSLFSSILLGYVWIIVVLSAGISFILLTTFKDAFRERAIEDLTRSAYALVPAVRMSLIDSTTAAVDSLLSGVSDEMNIRITVIERDGVVLGDTEKNPEDMENHRTRTEVIAAFNGIPGRSVRLSKTLGREMLYTAVPVMLGDSIVAVVRTSMFFDSFKATISPVANKMLLAILVATAIAVVSGWLISRRIANPMSNLADVADQVRKGRLEARAAPGFTREHNSLALSMNETLSQNEDLIKSLFESNSRSNAILQSMAEGVLVVSKGNEVLLMNDSFRNIFGIKNNDIPAEVAELFRATNREHKGVFRFESTTVAYQIAKVEGSGDFVFSFRDVTKEARLSRMKRDFVNNVSHELRTPLSAIRGYAEVLEEEVKGESARYIEIILRNTNRLIALVEDIQVLSEIERGPESLKIEDVPVSDILETVVPLFSSRAKEKNISINVVQTTAGLTVRADRYRIEQVFVNLIDNALKYTDSGTIEIRASKRGNLAVTAISDTGAGIPQESVQRVFERFFVVDRSRSRKIGGTGLGLAIAKHIVEAHGGTISVSSALGQGSIFVFTLPRS